MSTLESSNCFQARWDFRGKVGYPTVYLCVTVYFWNIFLSLFGKNILRDEVTVRNSALIRSTLRKNRQILERSKTAQDVDPMQILTNS